MRITVHSETDARRAAQRKLLPAGQYEARILEATETTSKSGNDMIELQVSVRGRDGSERELPDWLVSNDRGALKLRHAAEAVGALAKYEAGEIEQSDFVGQHVRVRIVIEKRRGYPDQNRIEDYARVR